MRLPSSPKDRPQRRGSKVDKKHNYRNMGKLSKFKASDFLAPFFFKARGGKSGPMGADNATKKANKMWRSMFEKKKKK